MSVCEHCGYAIRSKAGCFCCDAVEQSYARFAERMATALCLVPPEWLDGLARGDTDRDYAGMVAQRVVHELRSRGRA